LLKATLHCVSYVRGKESTQYVNRLCRKII